MTIYPSSQQDLCPVHELKRVGIHDWSVVPSDNEERSPGYIDPITKCA